MSSRTPETFREDILRRAEAIDSFILTLSFDVYAASLMDRSAVERQLQILTEASIRLRGTAKKLCPRTDWRAIRAFGNFLRHKYDYVSDRQIWDAGQQELPSLIVAVRIALRELRQQSPENSSV